jgi:hypothetical protein
MSYLNENVTPPPPPFHECRRNDADDFMSGCCANVLPQQISVIIKKRVPFTLGIHVNFTDLP